MKVTKINHIKRSPMNEEALVLELDSNPSKEEANNLFDLGDSIVLLF